MDSRKPVRHGLSALLLLFLFSACDTLQPKGPVQVRVKTQWVQTPERIAFAHATIAGGPLGSTDELQAHAQSGARLPPASPYGCLVSWALPPTAEYKYRHRQYFIYYDLVFLEHAHGKRQRIRWKALSPEGPDGAGMGSAVCFVPDSRAALDMIERGLRRWAEEQEPKAREVTYTFEVWPMPPGYQ